jgi:ADP-ribosyl-[dinitrogen reductase] hydrolase
VRALSQISRLKMDCVSSHANRDSIFIRAIESEHLERVKAVIGVRNNIIDKEFFIGFIANEGETFNRQIGAYMGMVLGDYLGAPIEFLPVINCSNSIRIGSDGSVTYPEQVLNPFHLETGQWTDDASMGACIADSLLVCDDGKMDDAQNVPLGDSISGITSNMADLCGDIWCSSFSGRDIRSRFWNWCINGYNNAFRYSTIRSPYQSVGLGGNISKSLNPLSGNLLEQIDDFYISQSSDSGNGGIMRLAPVPVFYSHLSERLCMKYCALSSQTTHPGPLASRAAEFLGLFIHKAINRNSDTVVTAAQFIDEVVADYIRLMTTSSTHPDGMSTFMKLLSSQESGMSTELSWNWKNAVLDIETCMKLRGDSYNGYPNSAGYYGSFCLDGLAIAMNAFRNTHSFDSCMMKCINYRGDADSTGSICGQMAGAFYGVASIQIPLLNNALKWDNSENLLRAIMLTSQFRLKQWDFLSQNAISRNPITYQHSKSSSLTGIVVESGSDFTRNYPEYPRNPPEIITDKLPKSVFNMLRSFFR